MSTVIPMPSKMPRDTIEVRGSPEDLARFARVIQEWNAQFPEPGPTMLVRWVAAHAQRPDE